jgi:hypothetical protein
MTGHPTPRTPWNPKWTLAQKLRRLKAIDPKIVGAVEILVDDALRRLWRPSRRPRPRLTKSVP